MNIGMIVDPYGEKSPGGLGRAIFEMAREILAQDASNRYTVYLKQEPKERPNFPGSHWQLKVLRSSYLWLTGARRIDRTLDLYIFFTPIIPLFFRPRRSIVVALDFAYLDMPGSTLRQRLTTRLLYVAHRRSLRLATKVVCISHATATDVIQKFNINESKVEVVHIGYIALGSKAMHIEVPEPFFLFAGVLKSRKNVEGVIRAFGEFCRTSHLPHHLVIAGRKEGPYYDLLTNLVSELGIEDRVTFTGYVTNEELLSLYQRATALVFPSLIEGFGMPILEAMDAGLPVITSSHGSLAEVAGDAALLVDAYDPLSIAQALGALASDSALGEELKRKGTLRAANFSWQKTGQAFLEVITRVGHTGQTL